jgi:predicted transcriptional regulator
MSTTTIRLPDELKARIAAAAERAGKTPHALILEAIAEKAEETERRSDFYGEAERRFAEIAASGKAIPWSEMRAYLQQRAAGGKPRRPAARKLAR